MWGTACPHSRKEHVPPVSECQLLIRELEPVLQCGSVDLYEASRQEGLLLRGQREEAFPISSLTVCGISLPP